MKTAFMNHKRRVESVKGELIIPEFLLISIVSYLPSFLRPFMAYVMGLRKQVSLQKITSLPILNETVPIL